VLLDRHGAPPFCFGDRPSLADCCLIPQIANAVRNCSCTAFCPMDTTTTSLATPFSLRHTASSTAISSKLVNQHLPHTSIVNTVEGSANGSTLWDKESKALQSFKKVR
jgi:hypothetical protein